MKVLLYGTTNEGKLLAMKRMLSPLGITLKGLKDMKESIPKVAETGSSPLENARIKAKAYYKIFQIPVFSCDTGLYLEGVPKELQPGIYVRRYPCLQKEQFDKYKFLKSFWKEQRQHYNSEMTDKEMTEYYSKLALEFGELRAQYQNAICFYKSEQEIYESEDSRLSGKPFLLTSKPHPNCQSGFPLDRISIQISSRKYYYDLPESAQDEVALEEGFQEFFIKYFSDF